MSQKHNTPYEERVLMVLRHERGETLWHIAQDMQLSYYTVRKWWRAYRDQGWAGLQTRPRGRPKQGPLGSFTAMVKYVLLRMKAKHPGWGLDKLYLTLQRRTSLQQARIPKRTSLYRYLRPFYGRFRRHRRLRTRRPVTTRSWASHPHECWQMDIKGDEIIPSLGRVRVFMVCDEMTSAPLAGRSYPASLPLRWRDIQSFLRPVFERWGLPDQLRLDRDPLWITPRFEFPSPFLLWLVGLGIHPQVNRPHRPTDLKLSGVTVSGWIMSPLAQLI